MRSVRMLGQVDCQACACSRVEPSVKSRWQRCAMSCYPITTVLHEAACQPVLNTCACLVDDVCFIPHCQQSSLRVVVTELTVLQQSLQTVYRPDEVLCWLQIRQGVAKVRGLEQAVLCTIGPQPMVMCGRSTVEHMLSGNTSICISCATNYSVVADNLASISLRLVVCSTLLVRVEGSMDPALLASLEHLKCKKWPAAPAWLLCGSSLELETAVLPALPGRIELSSAAELYCWSPA